MKNFLFLLGCLVGHSAQSQLFVNPSNNWYIDQCCYAIGQTHCHTDEYYFGDTVTVDTQVYRTVTASAFAPVYDLGTHYREFGSKVFMRMQGVEEEIQIYDFNLQTGAEIIMPLWGGTLKVLATDSVTLNSGEKRKRLEMGIAPDFTLTDYWIEGIGSVASPLNPLHSFSLDCWYSLNCFHISDTVAYQIGNCQLTATQEPASPERHFSVFPNPARQQLLIRSENGGGDLVSIEIINVLGQTCLSATVADGYDINIEYLEDGIYEVKAGFKNGQFESCKLIKQ